MRLRYALFRLARLLVRVADMNVATELCRRTKADVVTETTAVKLRGERAQEGVTGTGPPPAVHSAGL